MKREVKVGLIPHRKSRKIKSPLNGARKEGGKVWKRRKKKANRGWGGDRGRVVTASTAKL